MRESFCPASSLASLFSPPCCPWLCIYLAGSDIHHDNRGSPYCYKPGMRKEDGPILSFCCIRTTEEHITCTSIRALNKYLKQETTKASTQDRPLNESLRPSKESSPTSARCSWTTGSRRCLPIRVSRFQMVSAKYAAATPKSAHARSCVLACACLTCKTMLFLTHYPLKRLRERVHQ